jgi:uncharacterized protein (DUF111 family)
MILYLDCANGVSGDMLAAALLALADARSDERGTLATVVRAALKAAGIDPQVAGVADVQRGRFAAQTFEVAEGPGFSTFDELIAAVRGSELDQAVVESVAAVAERMADAEYAVHGPSDSHLHELAGLDTAVDLIAVAALLHTLAPDQVLASPPALGDGTIETAHGRLAVPAPAVLALLAGLPTAGGAAVASTAGRAADGPQAGLPPDESPESEPLGELTTPTGAALLAHFATGFGPLPAGRIAGVGYGAGSREIAGRPNLLRAVLIDETGAAPAGADQAALSGAGQAAPAPDDAFELLETNIDDSTAEVLAHAADVLRESGAVDVWFTDALMKKGRPGVVLHALVPAGERDAVAAAIFRETSTFGLRLTAVGRLHLEERRESVRLGGHPVAVRLGYLDGHLVTASPEYEDCRALAAAVGRPLKVVYEAAQATAWSRFGGV